MFHAHANIAGINLILIRGHFSIVQMSMNVAAETSHASRVNGNVAEQAAIHHMIGSNVAKVGRIFFHFEYVMIAFDQHFVAVQLAHHMHVFGPHRHISQDIYFVIGFDGLIPAFD